MLKDMSSEKSILSSVFQTASKWLIHPSWLRRAFMKLPFDKVEYGSLNVNFEGQTYRFSGSKAGVHAELIIVQPLRAYWLIKTQGELGFAQAYYEGALDTNSLQSLLRFGVDNQQSLSSMLESGWGKWQDLILHRKRHNSLENSRNNISYHYDLGNDFYSKWLDPSMTYSSGLFFSDRDSLQQSQHAKYQRILQQLSLRKGDSVLEIGCGWGGFMEEACTLGARVKGLTLSSEQQKYALKRLEQKAEQGTYQVALQDYRHETGQYDCVVSIEMFEAVGKEYWQEYFATLQNTLKPGGKAVLQVITIDDEIADSYQQSVDFIQKYIFPGGLLPGLNQLVALAESHRFEVRNVLDFGRDYARTCQLWKQAFNRQATNLEKMGYDKAFQRLWNYYLDYCTVGFEVGQISVIQVTLSKPV